MPAGLVLACLVVAVLSFSGRKEKDMGAAPNPVEVGSVRVGRGCPLALIAGPCVMEPGDMTLRIAGRLAELSGELGVPVIFKASFDKANRTSKSSYRGPGMDAGLKMFELVKARNGVAGDDRRA